jgi:chorismate--pyruvate lyase
LYGAALPKPLKPWLLDTGSLTQRLITSCDGAFCVRVLNQHWARPHINESQRLRMPANEYALIREVHLLCDGEPWVFARTVIPPHTLRGPLRRLARLQNKSLGAVLFANKAIVRTGLEIAHIDKDRQIYKLATGHLPQTTQPIWGRRSVFSLHRRSLLVSEIFLPQIGDYRAHARITD